MSKAKLEHQQWVNVMSMLLGKTPEDVEAAYQKVKAINPAAAADLTAPLMKLSDPDYRAAFNRTIPEDGAGPLETFDRAFAAADKATAITVEGVEVKP